ncbi:unnamed protein product [Mytilus coruscus]|uniref:Uncharacterized protein n=1 Tax=Mytilus coruscus TaxID=42192 RepID=A0A6J8CSD0_MYTCO|nr:unnamed protein product [Mytilus coruscus]
MATVLANIQRTRHNARKAISLGMLDVALFLSNVAQIKSVFDGDLGVGTRPLVAIVMISLSLLMQVAIGILIIMLLYIEGALLQLKQASRDNALLSDDGAMAEEVTNMEPQPVLSAADDAGAKKRSKLPIRARRINTAILCLIFGVLCFNLVINGLELSKPNVLKQLIMAYNITLPK